MATDKLQLLKGGAGQAWQSFNAGEGGGPASLREAFGEVAASAPSARCKPACTLVGPM